MARHSVMGGIYNRPLALANFLHFFVAGMAMLKAIAGGAHDGMLIAAGVIYATFAAAFGFVVFTSPSRNQT
jgi:hypothetical protein